MRYSFNEIEKCNMCGSDTEKHKIIGRRLNKSQGKSPRQKTGITVAIVRCTQCGLIYSNPLPIPLDIQDHYGVPPESYWKENYFELNPDYFSVEISRIKSLIPFQPGMKSLDVGAGIGKAMLAMERAGFDSFGIEPSKPFYERAISKMKINPEKIKNAAIENLDFPENYFDFITFGAVLEHLYDPSAAIGSALKCLKSNGIIHIEVPSSKWLVGNIINLYYQLIGTDFVGNISPMHVPYHLYEFDQKSFEMNSKLLGYEIAFREYYVCETTMPKSLDFILKPVMASTKTGMQLCVWLRKK